MAFVQNTTPTIIKQPQNGHAQITSTFVAGGSGTVYTAGANGSKITGLFSTPGSTLTPSSAISVAIAVSTGGTPNYALAGFTQSTVALSTAALPFNILTAMAGLPLDSDGNPYLHLVSGDLLNFIVGSSIASGTINLWAIGGDF